MFLGVPTRMARILTQAIGLDGYRHPNSSRKMQVIDDLLCDDDRVPLALPDGRAVGEGALHFAADEAARECYRICAEVATVDAIKIAIGITCRRRGIKLPVGHNDAEIIARAVDRGWWFRNLKREHIRRFEHTSIQIGTTGMTHDPYISREAALRQRQWNADNQKLLESKVLENEQGDQFTLAELAAKGTGNKTIRRGELMLRIRGFEEIADTLKHAAMFWTITCPSKYHAQGGKNAKYEGATPREAQAYLSKSWARMRAAFKRAGIMPYGFRIAEPHSDGCPHWHMLFFVDPAQVEAMTAIINKYALAEDGDEKGAQENRVKLVRIEAGKGTAAGYIAKYVSKNIDGAGVGDHKSFEDGRTYTVGNDMFGNQEITPSERVTYWSQVHGIRQFQQIGGAPVTVWREFRRLTADAIVHAPAEIQEAYHACQKVVSDDPAIAKQASFAAYVMAQGGVNVGRRYKMRIAYEPVTVTGKYATYETDKPLGIYAVSEPDVIYKSVRYSWTPVEKAEAVAVPWTGVNNCTQINRLTGFQVGTGHWMKAKTAEKNKIFSSEWSEEFKRYRIGDHEFDYERYKRLFGSGH